MALAIVRWRAKVCSLKQSHQEISFQDLRQAGNFKPRGNWCYTRSAMGIWSGRVGGRKPTLSGWSSRFPAFFLQTMTVCPGPLNRFG